MEITAGSYYKTRDGRKAFVACIIPPAPDGITHHLYPVIGHTLRDNVWNSCCWTLTGGIWRNTQANGDLVEPWREPRTKEVWVGLCEYAGELHAISDNTDRRVRDRIGGGILALKRVTLTEGEFDE